MRELSEHGIATIQERYLLKGETPADMFRRVAEAYASSDAHAERMYKYITKFWFMPSTPILTNGGTERGLPISCFLNSVNDSFDSISSIWSENTALSLQGGGIGTCWSNVRAAGEEITDKGASSGIIPFIKVMDSMSMAIHQGGVRRASAACYLHISHPEMLEFLGIRKISGDPDRSVSNLHHGVVISDEFMRACEKDEEWTFKPLKDETVTSSINARKLFYMILETRMHTGEPYIVFEGNVNKNLSVVHKDLGLKVQQSNLCSEIMLPTGIDYSGKQRTAVCCLGSLNAEYFEEWEEEPGFIEDCCRYLDNVLTSFIKKAEKIKGFERAVHSAMSERSIGLGVMGFHYLLQKNYIPIESEKAKEMNERLFSKIGEESTSANITIAGELGACPDAKRVNRMLRFSYTNAIAPTASISIIADTSPSIEPLNSNIFVQKTLSGSFIVKNKYLKVVLSRMGKDTQLIWDEIVENHGSVSKLEWMGNRVELFKTAFEIDQKVLIALAAQRQKYIDQSQSLNLFFEHDVNKKTLADVHLEAWRSGIKSLYYLRSSSAIKVSSTRSEQTTSNNGEVCEVCQ